MFCQVKILDLLNMVSSVPSGHAVLQQLACYNYTESYMKPCRENRGLGSVKDVDTVS